VVSSPSRFSSRLSSGAGRSRPTARGCWSGRSHTTPCFSTRRMPWSLSIRAMPNGPDNPTWFAKKNSDAVSRPAANAFADGGEDLGDVTVVKAAGPDQPAEGQGGLMKTGRNTDVLGLRVPAGSVALSGRSPRLKPYEEGRKAGRARRPNVPLEAPPKSSFPSFASVPRSDLRHAHAIRPAAITP